MNVSVLSRVAVVHRSIGIPCRACTVCSTQKVGRIKSIYGTCVVPRGTRDKAGKSATWANSHAGTGAAAARCPLPTGRKGSRSADDEADAREHDQAAA